MNRERAIEIINEEHLQNFNLFVDRADEEEALDDFIERLIADKWLRENKSY